VGENEGIVLSARSDRRKPGNRKLVAFFKVVIVSVLTVPWVVVAMVGIFSYVSSINYNQEITSYQREITNYQQDTQELQSAKEALQYELDDANRQLIEVTEEKEALQRSVLEFENIAAANGESKNGASIPKTNQDNGSNAENIGGTVPTGEQLEGLALQVIRGNWGNGLTRVINLQNEGYNHSIIQQRVNEIIWND